MSITMTPGEARIEPPAPHPQRRRFPVIGLVLLFVFALTLAGVFPFRQIIAQDRQVANARTTYDVLAERNAALEDEIAGLQTPVVIERLARENHGLVRPGETGYRAVVPDTPTTSPAAAATDDELLEIDSRSWWQKFTDFLTGRDLDPDG